ncbi:uncharacterized protein LOC111073646 isoform X2 [Drosophila obscura]|uniref:uncharacterized protein LOC111073646 isoform X2 n=1 Tax=Drosophila obscura TaxID=7282 RepID=UPI000BA0F408|nr:uncharacterized protein LOC111073646 isoform X2 [Drosophila obscura]
MFFQLYRTMEIYENLPSHLQNIPKIYRGIPVQSNKRKNFKQKCITKESFVEKLKNLVLSLEKGILKEQENVRQLKLVTGAMELDLEVPTLHCRDHIWSNRCSVNMEITGSYLPEYNENRQPTHHIEDDDHGPAGGRCARLGKAKSS